MDTKDKNPEINTPGVMFNDAPNLSADPLLMDQSDSAVAATISEVAERKPGQKSPTPFQDSMRRLLRDKRAVVSMGVIAFFVLLAIIGPPIYQHIGAPYNSATNGVVPASVYHNPFHQELERQDEFISILAGHRFAGARPPGSSDAGLADLYQRRRSGRGHRYYPGHSHRCAGRLLRRLDRPVSGPFHRHHVRLPWFALRHSSHRHLRHMGRRSFERYPHHWSEWQRAPAAGFGGARLYGLAVDGALCARANLATQGAAVC